MAVDLEDLIDSLKREVGTPGNENSTFPNATTTAWVGWLQDGFWEIYLDGFAQDYKVEEGEVSHRSPSGPELGGELQQLIVLYSGIRIVRNQLRQLNTSFRAKAGPVEYETQQSAQVLARILDELTRRRNLILERLSDVGGSESYYIDAVIERDSSINSNVTSWLT
jgi:hypothetical protein